MNRRGFLETLASGLLVPEWLLDPPKGRSMVSVPAMPPDMTFFPRIVDRETGRVIRIQCIRLRADGQVEIDSDLPLPPWTANVRPDGVSIQFYRL